MLLKQTFVFQKYTVYTYSVAIDTNIYKERSRLEWTSWKNLTLLPLALLEQDELGSLCHNHTWATEKHMIEKIHLC